MISEQDLSHRAIKAFRNFLDKRHIRIYDPVASIIIAQAWLESGGFNVKRPLEANRENVLVLNNNFFGLKWKRVLRNYAKPISFLDWENYQKRKQGKDFISEQYCATSSLEKGWELYLVFCMRRYYKNTSEKSKKRLRSKLNWIENLAYSGWCGSISGIDQNNYPSKEDYQIAVQKEYIKRVVEIHNSPFLAELCRKYNFHYEKINFGG